MTQEPAIYRITWRRHGDRSRSKTTRTKGIAARILRNITEDDGHSGELQELSVERALVGPWENFQSELADYRPVSRKKKAPRLTAPRSLHVVPTEPAPAPAHQEDPEIERLFRRNAQTNGLRYES